MQTTFLMFFRLILAPFNIFHLFSFFFSLLVTRTIMATTAIVMEEDT